VKVAEKLIFRSRTLPTIPPPQPLAIEALRHINLA
jgi:hypothetical protein